MKVKKVENFTEKSFNDYTGPDSEFKDKNFIFGYNGRGKTSLVAGIVNTFLKDESVNSDNYRLFDCNYMKNELLLKEDGNSKIKGVVANFGKKNVDLENEIDKLEAEIVDINELKEEINTIEINIRAEIDKIHDSRKGSVKINKKEKKQSVDKVISEYETDLQNALSIEEDENILMNVRGDDALTRKMQLMSSVYIPHLSAIFENEVEQIDLIFKKRFEDLDIPSSKVVTWINEGVILHEDSNNCKFCGSPIDLESIKSKVEEYNNNEKQKSIMVLTDFSNKISNIIYQIEEFLNIEDNFIANFGNGAEEYFLKIASNLSILKKYSDQIQSKIDNISSDLNFCADKLSDALLSTNSCCGKIRNMKNDQLQLISNKISKLNVLVKGAIGLEIKNSTFIKDNMELLLEKQKAIKASIEKNDEIAKRVEELKQQKSNTKDFADHINKILKMLEVNLRLDVHEDNYLIMHSKSRNILSIADISEGEKNLLSLLYFYYELFDDEKQKNLKSSIKLIIIDDPISSVDDINKMYILELIERIRKVKGDVQIFIFTHVWEDFCNICYNLKDENDNPYRFYEIKKDTKGSKILSVDVKETPYKHCFKEIYEFSCKTDCSDINDCELYHYPNIMRKVLEGYLSFKVKNSLPTRSNIENVKKALCGDSPSSEDDLVIGMLLKVCNILSHEHARNPDEILKSAKFLMSKIKHIDKIHFDTMKE